MNSIFGWGDPDEHENDSDFCEDCDEYYDECECDDCDDDCDNDY